MPETLTMIRGGGAPRIVAADDDVAMRELIALMRHSSGFDVVMASEAKPLWRRFFPTVPMVSSPTFRCLVLTV